MIHARRYKDASTLRNRKVLVVGAGNTGCDIAVEAATQAPALLALQPARLLVRAEVRLRPPGRPGQRRRCPRLPLRLRQWLFAARCRLTVGDLTRYGLPKPDHRVYETHPIVNSQLLYYIGHGGITPVARSPGSTATASSSPTATGSTRIWSSSRPATCPGSSSSARTCSTPIADGRPKLFLHTFARRLPDARGRRPGAARLRRLPDRALADRRDRALAAAARGRSGAGGRSSGARSSRRRRPASGPRRR